uniref:Uncharacterized protein n=1 Tax=Ditylum brightwellii TaxID=49249 RepID=A0A7S1ZEI7_9STRA
MADHQDKNIVVGIFNPGIRDSPNITISHPGSVKCIKSIIKSRGWLAVDLTTADLEEVNQNKNKLWSLRVDVLVLPGGEPRKMREALTQNCCRMLSKWRLQRKAIDDSANESDKLSGGGLVCICAGTVVACGKGMRGRNLVDGVELFDDNRLASAGLSGMVRLKCNFDTSPVIMAGDLALSKEKNKLRMMYCNGPLMSIRDPVEKSENVRADKTEISIWACYRTDLAAKCEARRISSEDKSLDNINEQYQNKNRQFKKLIMQEKWLCLSCGKLHFKSNKVKSCCGVKKREQEKERKLVQELAGVMPGKAAIVAVEKESLSCRTVLFGPHPEFSCATSAAILAESILWACWR